MERLVIFRWIADAVLAICNVELGSGCVYCASCGGHNIGRVENDRKEVAVVVAAMTSWGQQLWWLLVRLSTAWMRWQHNVGCNLGAFNIVPCHLTGSFHWDVILKHCRLSFLHFPNLFLTPSPPPSLCCILGPMAIFFQSCKAFPLSGSCLVHKSLHLHNPFLSLECS